AGRVRRRHVDDEVVGERRERLRRSRVVRDRLVFADTLGLADVDADHAWPATREPARGSRGAVVVEAEPVDERAVSLQPEHARLGIAGLCLGGERADLDEAKAEREQRGLTLRVLD